MTTPQLYRAIADLTEKLEAITEENEALKIKLQEVTAKVPTEEKRWFTNEEAAKFIGRSQGFLNKDRMLSPPTIPFSKHGHRTVKYDRADLEAYTEARRSKKIRH